MEKCLVTKLNSAVADNSLARVGEIVCTALMDDIAIQLQGKNSLEYYDNDVKKTITPTSGIFKFTTTKGNRIGLLDKYNITTINNGCLYFVNPARDLGGIQGLTQCTCSSQEFSIGELVELKNLKKFGLVQKSYVGSAKELGSLSSLESIHIQNFDYNSSVFGSVYELFTIPSLKTISTYSPKLYLDSYPIGTRNSKYPIVSLPFNKSLMFYGTKQAARNLVIDMANCQNWDVDSLNTKKEIALACSYPESDWDEETVNAVATLRSYGFTVNLNNETPT